ncbi:MAG: glycoside hydrolase family 15 protein [Rhodovibrionaceae bacterium]|nr:glycoside hydrolase family 15 protein [Rhodovibrionaceae bacterium]
MSTLDLAVIGNCAFGALIDPRGRIVWSCLPRFDADPMFCALLDDHGYIDRGFYDVEVHGFSHAEQRYRRNSAIVETVLHTHDGSALQITDFAPRFKQYERTFRPPMIVRQIQPLAGAPRIRIRLRPACDYGARAAEVTRGSNHVRYVASDITLRLTTDVPVTYVLEEVDFVLERPMTLIFGPDESLERGVADTGRDFVERTDHYWREWCRHLALPFEWQDAVIRAAITLKLSSFEESGAVIAAMTTSVPEAPHSGRTWDYRYCWLRDSYFVIHALNRMGVSRTMEGFLTYITNIVARTDSGHLQPVFGITLESRLDERVEEGLAGYRGMGPVRVGNEAYKQIQNDGYGSVILACAQAFYDLRLDRPGDRIFFERLERLGEQATALWDKPDAGLWELRTRQDVHTWSSLMCWVACDRLSGIARQLRLPERYDHWRQNAELIREGILEKAWNADIGAFTESFHGKNADASLLLMPEIGFLDGSDPRFKGTLAFIEQQLRRGKHLYRYAVADDFGEPETSFNICTFWYIDALAAAGRRKEARELFENMLACRNPLGLLSEDVDPRTGELWGNFPQTYSMVGIINSALKLSDSWEDAF